MESKNLLTLAITLTVGIILAGSLLMPVISDATTTERTYTNTGAFYVSLDPSDTFTIEYDKSAEPGVIYVNDEPLNVEFSTGYTIMAIDNAILRLQSGDYTLQYKGDGHYLTGINAIDITISNGSITGTYNTSTWPETTYTECFVASTTPEANVMTVYNTVSKMKGDSEIHAFGQTIFTTNGSTLAALVKIDGNITDGVDVAILNPTSGEEYATATIDDVKINATAIDGYINLYDLTSITFKAKILDTDNWTNVTYSAYIVPASVTAELSQHLNPAEIAILNALPVLIIVALVVMAAGALYLRRDD